MLDVEYARQREFDVRVEYGPQGLECLSGEPLSAIVIVDVLSFTTCVDIVVGRGARAYPFPWARSGAAKFAEEHDAILAGSRHDPDATYSLSPPSLESIPKGTRLVLPSPNGSALSFAAANDAAVVVAACIRNRTAVARFLRDIEGPIGLIAGGERWPDGTLRPCLEDLMGVGAIAAELRGRLSPEAENAVASFERFQGRLGETLESCSSGRELTGMGFKQDVVAASKLDASDSVPLLANGYYAQAP